MRLLTYNIHGMKAGAAAVGAVIRAARADVVVIQEAPRIRWRSRCAELARQAGLVYVAGGHPAARNLILSSIRVELHAVRDARLSPSTPRQTRRGAACAVLSLGESTFGVVGVHGGLQASERARHATEIAGLAKRLRGDGAQAIVVAGDLNASSDAPEFAALIADFRDAWLVAPHGGGVTYPPNRARIDAVLVDSSVEVIGCGVPDLGMDAATLRHASDHWPVLATLRFPTSQSIEGSVQGHSR